MNETFPAPTPVRTTAPLPLAAIVARTLALVSVAIVLGALAFGVRYTITSGNISVLLTHQSFLPVVTIIFAGAGAAVAARHPRNPVGWIFVTVAFLYAVTSLSAVIRLYPPVSIAVYEMAGWLNRWVWVPAIFLPTILLFFLFPDGRHLSPRWRLPFWLAAVGLAALITALAFHPDSLPEWGLGANPFGWSGAETMMNLLLDVGGWLLLIGFLGSLGSFVLRYHRSHGIERKQLQWLLYAIVVGIVFGLLTIPLWVLWPTNQLVQEVNIIMTDVTLLAIACAATVAILRYRLYDIDIVINRTVLYSALSLCIIGIYGLIVTGLSALFRTQDNPVVAFSATGVVAVLVQPLTDRLQRGVNRFFYGERDDPLRALAQLGQRLEAAVAPDILLPTLVETIAQTLKFPYVAVRLRSGEEYKIAAQCGTETAEFVQLPIIYQGDSVGMLLVGTRGPGEAFSRADHHLLRQIAHQAGPTAHTVQLTEDLRQSRMRLVTAREEERRRLRRDLHDGLGPVLASQGLKLAAVSQLMTTKPDQAQQFLAELGAQNERTVAEIRRLVYQLRPAALDELGLVGAVSDFASDLKGSAEDAPRLYVEVQAPPVPLPFMTAAIEAAAYRIATEALTNVVRHAAAHRAVVTFALCDRDRHPTLQVEIKDDGIGLADRHRAGVGLLSMRERAEELSGSVTIESTPGKGTRIVARLPLVESE